jgi:hypothetical protein
LEVRQPRVYRLCQGDIGGSDDEWLAESLRALAAASKFALKLVERGAADSVLAAHIVAKELVALQPEVILSQGTAITAAFQRESRTVPISSGFVASPARPDGNLTGLLMYEAGITGKWLAMLKEVSPHLSRAALMASSSTAYDHFLRAATAAAQLLAIELVPRTYLKIADCCRSDINVE